MARAMLAALVVRFATVAESLAARDVDVSQGYCGFSQGIPVEGGSGTCQPGHGDGRTREDGSLHVVIVTASATHQDTLQIGRAHV